MRNILEAGDAFGKAPCKDVIVGNCNTEIAQSKLLLYIEQHIKI